MSFSPVLVGSGYTGWLFLKRTMETQQTVAEADPALKRDEAYFRENIGKVTTAEELVSDRRLLRVALGAFGLDDDINSSFFIRKVLEDGTTDSAALARKLADKQYAKLSAAFGFGDAETSYNQMDGFADKVIEAYKTRQFEISVGETDDSMRLALNAERELADIASGGGSNDAKWFTVMGSEPLRSVFETALGLPTGFGLLDIDKQLEMLRSKTEALLGDGEITQFAEPEQMEKLIRRFMLRTEASQGYSLSTPGAGALQLLQSGGTAASLLSTLYSG